MSSRLLPRALAALGLSLVVALSTPGAAGAVQLGISDSDDTTFTETYWAGLHASRARAVVPYDVALTPADTTTSQGRRRAEFDRWVAGAQAHGVTPLVAFEASLVPAKRPGGRPSAPTPEDFAAAFASFLQRYPTVRAIAPWNEPNNPDARQYPLRGDPARAAAYWLGARDACAAAGASCTLLAGDFAGIVGDDAYVDAYQAALGTARPAVWAFHAHGDVNDFQSPSAPDDARVSRYYLGKLDGPWQDARVWIDEVGARYRDADGTTIYGDDSQQRATQFVLGLATLSTRIDQIYYYNYANECRFPSTCAPQDRGLVSPKPLNGASPGYDAANRRRPAYDVVASGGPVLAPSPAVAPLVTLDEPGQGALVATATPTFRGRAATGNGIAPSVTVQVFAGVGASESSTPLQTLTAPVSAGAYGVMAARLPDGTYSARARQAGEGDAGVSDPHTFTVDTTAPGTSISAAPAPLTGARAARFTLAASEAGVILQCRLDRAAFAPCGPSVRLVRLGVGRHTFAARAVDAAGNVQVVPVSFSWRVVSLAGVLAPRVADLGATLTRGLPLAVACADACALEARLYLPAGSARRAGLRGRALRPGDPGPPAGRGYLTVAAARGRRSTSGATGALLRLAVADRRRLRGVRGVTLRLGLALTARGSRRVTIARRVTLRRGALSTLVAHGVPAVLACSEACAGAAKAYADRASARRARLRGRLVSGSRSGLPGRPGYLALGVGSSTRASGGAADLTVVFSRPARGVARLPRLGLRLVTALTGPGSRRRFLGWPLVLAAGPR